MSDLILCETCLRHLRRNESSCPFCGADVRIETRAALPRVAPTGMSRARLYAFHAAVATGVAACGAKTGADLTGASDSSVSTSSMSAVTTAGETGGQTQSGSSSTGAPDAVAQNDSSAPGTESGSIHLVGPDASAGSDAGAITDAAGLRDWGPIPLPYGSVFPAVCDDDVIV